MVDTQQMLVILIVILNTWRVALQREDDSVVKFQHRMISSTFAAHRMGAWKGRAKSEGASETFSFQINP